MKALLVYDSHFGYTEQIARAVAAEIEQYADATVVRVGDPSAHLLAGYDLLIVGGPTEGHGPTPAMREWLSRVDESVVGVAFVAFDTRVAWPKVLSGSAAADIARDLTRAGAHLLVEPESFIVHGRDNPAPDAAVLDHVRGWVGRVVAATPMPVG